MGTADYDEQILLSKRYERSTSAKISYAKMFESTFKL